MRLYKMTFEIEVVVYAEDENEAEEIAESAVREEVENAHFATGPDLVTDRKQIPLWIGSLPYVKERFGPRTDERTVEQILDAQAEEAKAAEAAKDTMTIDMFAKGKP